MSQATRALVERLKRETTHLPGNVPLHNKALETITEIFDSMVEPAEEPEPAEETAAEDGGTPVLAEESVLVEGEPDDAEAAQQAADEGAEDGNDPMTTGNAPT